MQLEFYVLMPVSSNRIFKSSLWKIFFFVKPVGNSFMIIHFDENWHVFLQLVL